MLERRGPADPGTGRPEPEHQIPIFEDRACGRLIVPCELTEAGPREGGVENRDGLLRRQSAAGELRDVVVAENRRVLRIPDRNAEHVVHDVRLALPGDAHRAALLLLAERE